MLFLFRWFLKNVHCSGKRSVIGSLIQYQLTRALEFNADAVLENGSGQSEAKNALDKGMLSLQNKGAFVARES